MTYVVESIRNLVHEHAPLPQVIQNIVIGYTATIGDILMYLPVVFPEAEEDGMSYYMMPTAMNIGIWIRKDDASRMTLIYHDHIFTTRLAGNEDPFDDLMTAVAHEFGEPEWCEWSLHECMPDIKRHIASTYAACLKHLLS